MKTIKELITELLFADDCTLLTRMKEALQRIKHFSSAAKNFSLIIGPVSYTHLTLPTS